MNQLNLRSLRARKARLAASLRPYVYQVSLSLVLVGMAVAAWGGWSGLNRLPFAAAALALLGLMLVFWYRLDLSQLPPRTPAASLDDILEDTLLGALRKNAPLTPASAWQAACKLWPGRFLINHLLINEAEVGQLLDGAAEDMAVVWDSARQLAEKTSAAEVDAGALAAALLTTSEAAKKYLAAHNLNAGEITETLDWQARLKRWLHQLRPYFGGIGRDWAAGFTPELDHFGVNVSRAIESGRAGHYHTLAHADILDSVVHNLSQGSGALALVGEAGAGKTSLAYALAQRLLEGRDESLLYYQLIELNAAQIISASGKELEKIAMTLFGEAAHASNVIIFLDDARLFFGQGTGAFDIGQVLMPLLQNRVIKIIAAFTPNEFQSLKAANEALAADFAIIAVKEPS
ncbi:MAG TPA: AAA family ATPase, partial [Candidatus Nitrosopolaris sp.]|nr:AAA family ATPase [Candidatus Nitrosopolaris sp.]